MEFMMEKIYTNDSQEIAFSHIKAGHASVLIVAHGFYNNKDTFLFKDIADMFAKEYDVILFDFRGHGKSSGLFTWTSKEPEDLRTIIDYAKKQAYQKIGVVGFSLGAAITLIEASQNQDMDCIISVSAPYDFWKIDYRFWEEEMLNDLKLNIGPKGKGKGIRPGNPFIPKVRPIDIVHKISPIPILFAHGEKDWLIAPHHSETLYEKALEPKQLHIFPKAGHAEKIYDNFPKEFEHVCLDWLKNI